MADEWAGFDLQPAAPEPRAKDDEWAGFNLQPAPAAKADDEWKGFNLQPAAPRKEAATPEAEGAWGTFAREVLHEAGPTVAGAVTGAGTAAAAGAAVSGPLAPVAAIGAGLVGGGIGGYAASKAQQGAGNLLGFDDDLQRTANRQAHPWAAAAGDVLPALIPFGWGAKAGQAAAGLGGRAVSGAITGGADVASQYAQTGTVDPLTAGLSAATGAIAPYSRGFLAPAERLGAQIGERLKPAFHGTPGAEAAAGTAEAKAEPPGARGGNTDRYAKEPVGDYEEAPDLSARPGPTAATVGEEAPRPGATTDPTLNAALDAGLKPPETAEAAPRTAEPAPPPAMEEPAAGVAPRTMAAERVPDDVVRGPAGGREYANLVYPEQPSFHDALISSGHQYETFEGADGKTYHRYTKGGTPQEALAGTLRPDQAPTVGAAPGGGGPAPPGGGGPPLGQPPGGGGRRGAPGVLPPAAGALQPATSHDLQEGLIASLRRMIVPRVSPSADIAASAIREAGGPLKRLQQMVMSRFENQAHRTMNRMDQPAFERFVDAIETNQVHTLPTEQQPIAQKMRQGFDDYLNAIQSTPQHAQMQAVQDFFTHMYKNTPRAQQVMADYFGTPGGSLRKRTFPTFKDAIAAGLEPLSTNPIEYLHRYTEGINQYLAPRRLMNDLEQRGYISWHAARGVGASGQPDPLVRNAPPEGYAKIEPPWASKSRGPVEYNAYAPRDMADTINNFYSTGLNAWIPRPITEFARMTKNMWTGLELGLSPYHAFTELGDTYGTGLSRVFMHMAGGDWTGAAKQMAQLAAEPYLTGKAGGPALQRYRGQATGSAADQRIAQSMGRANIRPGDMTATGEYDMTHLNDFVTAGLRGSLGKELAADWAKIKGGDIGAAASFVPRQVGRALQTISAPLFQGLIPRLKMGALQRDAEAFLRIKPNATDAELDAFIKKQSDSIDNRMGEMNKDNLFMSKWIKDAGYILMRSFNWTIGGPIREIAGGAASGIRGALKGENRLDPRNLDTYDPRVAYAAAFPIVTAAMASIYQYMKTGKGPEDWRDLVTPQTGGMVKSGGSTVPERVLLPGYHKDFLGYAFHPGRELSGKVAAPWQALKEQVLNEDWRGKPIVPPRATVGEQLKARAGALGTRLEPFGVKQVTDEPVKGTALGPVARGLGFRSPGAYIQNPKGSDRGETARAQKAWEEKERLDNAVRRNQGLPPLPKRPLPRTGYEAAP